MNTGENIKNDLLLIKYGKYKLYVKKSETFVFYATYISNEYYKLKIKGGDTVLDFGANIGDFTVKAAKLVGESGRVIAIEPYHSNVEILKLNLEINNINNVEIYEYAISDHNGFVYLEENTNVGSKISSYETNLKVKGITIDSLLEDLKIFKNVVIKMDIEGAEKFAFESNLFLSKIREISVELHGKDNISKILEILKNNNFKISKYKFKDEIQQTLKSIIRHPIDFLKIEKSSNYLATKEFLNFLKFQKNPIPSINNTDLLIIYACKT